MGCGAELHRTRRGFSALALAAPDKPQCQPHLQSHISDEDRESGDATERIKGTDV